MAKTDNPEVQRFHVQDTLDRDDVTIYLGPDVGMIKTCKWPRNEKGEDIGKGNAQTITLTRQSLIGLAYEILQAVK